MEAYAILHSGNDLFICCPHCNEIHKLNAAETPRLIPIPAACDATQNYTISAIVKPKSLIAALHLRDYELARKRKQYARRHHIDTTPPSDD